MRRVLLICASITLTTGLFGCAALGGYSLKDARAREQARMWLGDYSGEGDRFVQQGDYRYSPLDEDRVSAEWLRGAPAALLVRRTGDDRGLQLIAVVDTQATQRAEWLSQQPRVHSSGGAVSLKVDWADLGISESFLQGDTGEISWSLERSPAGIEGTIYRVRRPTDPEEVIHRPARSRLILRSLTPHP